MIFFLLKMATVKLVLRTVAIFANSQGLISPLVYALLITDATGSANIVHYDPNLCLMIPISVILAELLALLLVLYFAYIIKHFPDTVFAGTFNSKPT